MGADEGEILKWDTFILAAGSEKQKEAFQAQIFDYHLRYFDECFVIVDHPEHFKIGSGGATLNILKYLYDKYGKDSLGKRILLLHNGGYSQRLPHVSATGKIFMTLPNGKSLLDVKLDSYREVLTWAYKNQMTGVFVGAADTLVNFSNMNGKENGGDIVLFAHQSPLRIAQNHGVYVLNERKELVCVLQKPTALQLEACEAFLSNDPTLSLTDSYYWIGAELMKALIDLRQDEGEVHCELCCYGDFLRPLGNHPKLGYLGLPDEKNRVQRWRSLLVEVMRNKRAEVIDLGPQSFYHFGTNKEMLHNFFSDTKLSNKFFKDSVTNNIVYSKIGKNVKVSRNSFVEFSNLIGDVTIKQGCIISGVMLGSEQGEPVSIEENSVLVSLILDKGKFTTLFFNRDVDLKTRSKFHQWFESTIQLSEEKSLWECPLLPVATNLAESVKNVLEMRKHGAESERFKGIEKCSISEALKLVDIKLTLEIRNSFKTA